MTDEEEFSVYMFFPDDTYECVARMVNAENAVLEAKKLTNRPAVHLGVIKRIIITDGGDLTVFEWKHGEGVTFPPRHERKNNAQDH